MQGKGSDPLKVLIMENKVIYQSINQLNLGWCHTVIKFNLHYLTVTLLNISVKLSSNLDITCTIKKKSEIRASLLTQSFELLSGSIGWGAGLQSSTLVQGKGSNPLKVLIKEKSSDLSKYKSAKLMLASYCH